MKKVIVTAVAALMTTIATAASCLWDVDTVYEMGSSESATGYLAYFVDADAFDIASAVTAINGGDTSFLNNTAQAWEASDLADDGYVEGLTDSVFGDGVDVNGYLIIFNGDTIDSATHAYVSGIASASTTMLGGAAAIYFDDEQLEGMQDESNWVSLTTGGTTPGGDVPEPTSGLLLMLGVAGLALRRKVK